MASAEASGLESSDFAQGSHKSIVHLDIHCAVSNLDVMARESHIRKNDVVHCGKSSSSNAKMADYLNVVAPSFSEANASLLSGGNEDEKRDRYAGRLTRAFKVQAHSSACASYNDQHRSWTEANYHCLFHTLEIVMSWQPFDRSLML